MCVYRKFKKVIKDFLYLKLFYFRISYAFVIYLKGLMNDGLQKPPYKYKVTCFVNIVILIYIINIVLSIGF